MITTRKNVFIVALFSIPLSAALSFYRFHVFRFLKMPESLYKIVGDYAYCQTEMAAP